MCALGKNIEQILVGKVTRFLDQVVSPLLGVAEIPRQLIAFTIEFAVTISYLLEAVFEYVADCSDSCLYRYAILCSPSSAHAAAAGLPAPPPPAVPATHAFGSLGMSPLERFVAML